MTVLIKEPREIVEATAGFSQETVRQASAAKDEPSWMLDFRLQAWQTFENLPWPKPTDEAWRRTRLTGFKLENFTPFAIPDGIVRRYDLEPDLIDALDEMESSASLIYRDGGVLYVEENEELDEQGVIFTDLQSAVHEHPELMKRYFMTEAVTPDANKFAALHAALWDTGTFIFVPRNTKVELPLQAILCQGDGVGGYHHTLLVAEEGAEVTLVDDLMGAENAFQATVVELILKDNAQVRYINLQDYKHTAWNFLTGKAVMGKDTDLRWIQVSWGSRLTKAFLDLDMQGEGGHGELLGLYFPTRRQHIDHQTLQLHRVANCYSDLLFNGALKHRAHSVYMGIIKVLPGAQKTDAFQRNGNLILDGTARSDSIPGLEIEADDVRCTHAATAAQVEDEYVFYLMARGLTRPQAERMIVQGFLQGVLDRVPVESVMRKLERVISRKISR
ncbi:MAG: Fe-S cluster assembly protein SufD [Caldilineaceae bacterium SB0670_bin_27]|uniref:Fe-S cluster assembly protein SufD n=1 Tax=Caldilineaceae bacterium SB0664_bin_27 TaxID=2605260 RepID=A0A6B0YUW1_9CHLR|nr:Fe-S cluster assembly protein SufD [Caldilineaceae bacterium SB0664_bin_27]MYJ78150.1 Fe-S cluster assembly protein SufD [Caldilineaceae bacterium SB0670_bin_27]